MAANLVNIVSQKQKHVKLDVWSVLTVIPMNIVIMERMYAKKDAEQVKAVKMMNTVMQEADNVRKAADCKQIAVKQKNIAIQLAFVNLDALHMLIVHQMKYVELTINVLRDASDLHAVTIQIVQLLTINIIVHAKLASSQKRARDVELNKLLM